MNGSCRRVNVYPRALSGTTLLLRHGDVLFTGDPLPCKTARYALQGNFTLRYIISDVRWRFTVGLIAPQNPSARQQFLLHYPNLPI